MPKAIRHLRMEDRKIIARMIKDKKPQTEIAHTLGFSQGTISKELKRNSGRRGFRPGGGDNGSTTLTDPARGEKAR